MRRMTICAAIVAAVLTLAVAPVFAKKPAGTTKPATLAKTQAPKAKTTTPKTTTPKTSKGATMKTAKATTPKAKSATTTTTKSAKASAPGQMKKSSTTTASSSTTSGTTTTSGTPTDSGSTTTTTQPVAYSALAKKLSTKPKQLEKLMSAAGISSTLTGDALTTALNGATSGFKNFGQIVAASNASANHNLEFADLKALMTGLDMTGQPVTGTTAQTGTLSLGQAMKKLGMSDAEAEAGATQATTQATIEIGVTSAPTTSTTSTATKKNSKSKSKKKTPAATTPTGGGV